jgi:hypothetical protein
MFVLSWLVRDVTLWISALLSLSYFPSSGSLITHAPALALLIFCIFMWMAAPWIGRLTCRDVDVPINLSGLTRYDLYCFGFVFLGLLFSLNSLADVIDWTHFFATAKEGTFDPNSSMFYQLTHAIITFVAGLTSLLGASRWAKKLSSYEEKLKGV